MHAQPLATVICVQRDSCHVFLPTKIIAFMQITRVLKPGGHLLFIEHVGARFSEAPLIAAAQVLLEPLQVGIYTLSSNVIALIDTTKGLVWRTMCALQMAMADGCHLTRKTGELLRQETCWASLQLTEDSVPGLGLLAPHVWGLAKRA
jgi:SAM-dependent methyltransferase